MKGITVRPELNPERYYTTAEAVRILEMDRSTFWRRIQDSGIKYKFQRGSMKRMYQGKELIKFWKLYLMPI